MEHILKKAKRDLSNRYPMLKKNLSYLKYWEETLALLKNKSEPIGNGPIIFTSQKCASTYLSKVLKIITSEYTDLNVLNYEGLYWNTKSGDIYKHMEKDADRLFRGRDKIFGPLREYIDIPLMKERPIILMLRDPRDVVVSSYYSVAFSHSIPGGAENQDAYLKRREEAASMSLDEYVMFASEEYRIKYQKYAHKLLSLPNVTFLTYEMLVTDVRLWATTIVQGLNLELRDTVIAKMVSTYETGQPKGQEDIHNHRRSGIPGEYLRKLRPETIEWLNKEFKETLEVFHTWPQ